MEARKLIAEAIQSIESIDTGHVKSKENDRHPSLAPTELVSQVEKEIDSSNGGFNQAELRGVNGTKILASSKDEDLNFTNLTFNDILTGDKELLPTSSTGCGLTSFNLGSLVNQSSLPQQLGHPEPNGNLKSEKNPQPNGFNVQHMKEKTPSKSVAATKKWVCGRLVEVTEGG